MNRIMSTSLFNLLLLLAGCGQVASTDVPTPTPEPTAVIAPEVIEAIETQEPVLTAVPESTLEEEDSTGVVQTREPQPTATPGFITSEVEKLFDKPDRSNSLWLDTADWINLLISLVIVAVSYLLSTWLIYWALARVVRRTQSELDDQLVKAVRSNLRWLVVILTLRFATKRPTR